MIDVTNEDLFDFPEDEPNEGQHDFSLKEFRKWLSKERKKEKEAKVVDVDKDKEDFKDRLRKKRKKD